MTNRKKITIIVLAVSILLCAAFFAAALFYKSGVTLSPYPDGKKFAFTITDDPDGVRLEKIQPVYELLYKLGFRTTMACWVYRPVDLTDMPDPDDLLKSASLEDAEYSTFLKEYQAKGFEIALHTVTAGNDTRKITVKGYEKFKEVFGEYPKINIMHSKNKENVYWGKAAFDNTFMKKLVNLYTKVEFSGEDTKSSYFWGDVAKEKTKYIRMWGTWDLNTLKFNPSMPYHDPDKPFVNYWFSFSDGFTARFFNKLLSDKNIEKLCRERGASIVYTHLACGFVSKTKDGSYILNDRFVRQLTKISQQNDGWFVPASVLLDRLLAMKNVALSSFPTAIIITNSNDFSVGGVTILAGRSIRLYDSKGKCYIANGDGEIVIGGIGPQQAITLFKDENAIYIKNQIPGKLERFRLILGKLMIMMFSHRG